MNANEFKGYSLFNDVEDSHLKQRNRAIVLANIAEDFSKNRMMSAKGISLIMGYFNEVPESDREEVKQLFSTNMKERGFVRI